MNQTESSNAERYYVGVDLGQAKDFTAVTTTALTTDAAGTRLHDLVHLHRFPLGTPYPQIVADVRDLVETPQLRGRAELVVDATGAGRPVVDMMREAGLWPLTAVTITSGHSVTREDGYTGVPKRDLVSTLQVLLQDDRLRFAEGLPGLDLLKGELLNFKAKIKLATGHDSYEAWREKDHDDLVLALALACWMGEQPYYEDDLSVLTWTRGSLF